MTQLTAQAIRKNGYWIALFDGYPSGGVSGDTLAELHQEMEAVKHFILDLPVDVTIDVEYVYDLGDEQAAAGISERDGAVMMGLSKQRVHQLKHA